METATLTTTHSLASEQAVAELKNLLPQLVGNRELHGQWLNSLAYMEHVGATKIARTQSGERATITTLKHAAEEARHGFYLKRLALKVNPSLPEDFRQAGMLAPVSSRQYLHRLDIAISRMLRQEGLEGETFRKLAYLLVTYAIEVRADDLYPVYQAAIENYPIKISVRTIINEEEGHLAEMTASLEGFPFDTQPLMQKSREIEAVLFRNWIGEIRKAVEVF